MVANYDIIHRKESWEYLKLFPFETAILDEAHYIKSSKSKRTKVAIELTKRARQVYLLTGTPLLNRPEELFTLLQAIGHPLGVSWYNFVLRYCGAYWRNTHKMKFDPVTGQQKEIQFLDISGATNLQELHERIKPFYLRRTKEILGDKLPAKIITNIPVELDKSARAAYARTWDDYLVYLDNNPVLFSDLTKEEKQEKIDNILMTRHLVELQKLKQVVSLAKIPTIIEEVKNTVEQGEKVIIFTQYTQTLRDLREQCRKEGITAVTLSGEDDAVARQLSIDSFQKYDQVKVFIGNIKAAGVGITLTQASTVMFADMEWTPALHEQAEDRAHRIGQSKQVNVHYYVAKETIEEDIIELLGKKSQIIARILEGDDKRVRQLNITAELIKRISTQHK
jgi:SWI/SNF-related matrix-associated actin-dependent regulator 1 of chromatin subfamily A